MNNKEATAAYAYEKKKRAKRVKQRKKRSYVSELIAKLSSLSNANWREYWDTLEELKALSKEEEIIDTGIDIPTWTNHFSHLFQAHMVGTSEQICGGTGE